MSRLSLGVFSYNVNLMLASIIALLLVILFVLLLHIYAMWFVLRARRRRITRRANSLSGFLRGLHHMSSFSNFDAGPTKGLDPSLIASIPVFLYGRGPAGFQNDNDDDDRIMEDLGLECVICLSDFEDGDIGRSLAKCGHAFHAECIDMWLHSHTTCPICRAPAVSVPDVLQDTNNNEVASRNWEAVIDVADGNNSRDNGDDDDEVEEDEEEGEVVSVVMDVFIVSVSVSRAGSTRQLAEDQAA